MDEKILKRIVTKLDLIIELLRDRILTTEEIALVRETDVMIKIRDFQEFIQL